MKIKTIEIENFRAFYGKHTIETQSKNMLIYGENGSGKSSFYHAIHDFFSNAYNPDKTKFVQNQWNKEDENPKQSKIALTFDDGNTYNFTPSEHAPQKPVFIPEVGKQQPFFTYKRLLQTYLDNNVNKKMFHLLVDDILGDIQSNNDYTINQVWQNFKGLKDKYGSLNGWDRWVQEYMATFNQQFKENVEKLVSITNLYLQKYFNNNIELKIVTPQFKSDVIKNSPPLRKAIGKQVDAAHVKIEIKLFGEKIKDYQNFLNEARLSALSVSMYLASLQIISAPEDYQIIFLDDIFIGLDTSNRLPLLEILKKEFSKYFKLTKETFEKLKNEEVPEEMIKKLEIIENAKYYTKEKLTESIKTVLSETGFDSYKEQILKHTIFHDWQIFITTYDRNWFEIAKANLQHWNIAEIYLGKKENTEFETPIVITSSETPFQKAEKYFNKKGKSVSFIDYPAAGNYLRKECENLLKQRLYGKYLLKSNKKTGETTIRADISELFLNFEKMITDLNNENSVKLDFSPFKGYQSIIKAVLNPLSHDNLDKPIFRNELVKAFRLIEDLQKVKIKTIAKKGETLVLAKKNSVSKSVRKTYVEVKNDDIRFIQINNTKIVIPAVVKPIKYIEGGSQENLSNYEEMSVEKNYDMVIYSLTGKSNASKDVDIYSEFKLENSKSLRSFIDEL